jgi:hypothetical protein
MFGRPTKYKMVKPGNVTFFEEKGCNINQKTDGHIGGELFVWPSGSTENGVRGACTNIHFSVSCFKNTNGDAIMFAIIVHLMKDFTQLPANVKEGIDRTIKIDKDELKLKTMKVNLQNEFIFGGPTCTYLGNKIPCFTGCSPNAIITSQMLAIMLEVLDTSNILDCDNGTTSFLLLDGNHSRFDLLFLLYIHSEQRKRICCIRVSYGTHLWQVADSSHFQSCTHPI